MKQRIQFYPSNELMQSLSQKAAELQVPVSQLVKDILESTDLRAYKPQQSSFSALYPIVIAEIEAFVMAHEPGKTFTLREASSTYNEIPQTIYHDSKKGARTNTLRARIGRIFKDDVSSQKIRRVAPMIVNGRNILDQEEHASVYVIEEVEHDKCGTTEYR